LVHFGALEVVEVERLAGRLRRLEDALPPDHP